MWKFIGALSLIIGGLIGLLLSFIIKPKNLTFIDEISLKKYLKYKKLLGVLVGGSFVLIGILYSIDLLMPEKTGIIVAIIYFVSRILEGQIFMG